MVKSIDWGSDNGGFRAICIWGKKTEGYGKLLCGVFLCGRGFYETRKILNIFAVVFFCGIFSFPMKTIDID